MKPFEVQRRKWFLISLSCIALLLNFKLGTFSIDPGMQLVRVAEPDPQPAAHIPQAHDLEKQRDLEQSGHAKAAHRAKYLNPSLPSRVRGVKNIAILCLSDGNRLNGAMATSIIGHFKDSRLSFFTSVFTPAFVTYRLFHAVWDGKVSDINLLELPTFLDTLLFVRQQVRYTENRELGDLITASMTLELLMHPTASPNDSEVISVMANGAGFRKDESLRNAEERIFKQLQSNPRFTQLLKD
jgi:hypothetical protein